MPYLFDTVIDQTISASTAGKNVNVAGYEVFALQARFQGPPNATVYMEVNQNNLLVTRETIALNAAGWLNLTRTYRVFSPSIGVVFYHPTASMSVRMTLYAAI